MILKKPYAFLIKYFRIIHFILTVVLLFIAYSTNNIYKFFSEYIRDSNYLRIFIEPKMTSIPWYIYIFVLISIVIFSSIFILMNKKKKPIKFYFISIIFYFLLAIVFIFSSSQMFTLLQDRAAIQLINITRDMLRIFLYLQYVFVLISLLRTIGFNIKKFDFKNDLKEMDILEEDNEEFEFDLNLDINDVNTKFRRVIRIIKYVINENKKFLFICLIGVVSYITISIFLNIFIYNRLYRQNEKFKIGELQIKITDSYETTKAYNMQDISSDKYVYYVVKSQIKNTSSNVRTLNIENIRLKVSKNKSYQTDKKYYSSFVDVGEGYYKQKIESNAVRDYIFVFKVDKDYKKTSKTFEILKSITNVDGEVNYNYTKVKIKPVDFDDIKEKNKASLNQKMVIDDNILGNIDLTIENIDFIDSYEYKYNQIINNNEYSFTNSIQQSYDDLYGKKIMRLKYNFSYSNVSNEQLITNFITNFGHIRYIKNGKEYDNPFKIVEKEVKEDDGFKYVEVFEKVAEADNIWLDIIIRNKQFIYKLK